MLLQRTIAKQVSVTGVGIHSGKKVTLVLHPAKSNFGIQFKRADLLNAPAIRASAKTVSATENATTIGEGANVVHTIEHLVGVLYGLGIDNVFCEIDGPEVPIMDGSGASFAFVLKDAGVSSLSDSKKFLIVTRPVKVAVGDKWAQITPSSKLIINSSIVFAHPTIKTQIKEFEFSCENFINEICRARTFGFLKDVDMLKRKGLAKGGSLDNCIILDDFKVVNPEGLRFVDEFIRHKILDIIGDFGLLGHEIAAKITTYKSGHMLHNMLCQKLLSTPNAYKIVSSASLEEDIVSAFKLPMAMSPAFH